jgi:two-component system LytT family response regulator
MKLTAAIIEDESKLREVFVQLLQENCPEIEIIGEASNIADGYSLILLKKPQVVFLDIEMPGGNGFELLSKFEKIPFETIFVSSYGHYAIKALKLSALDYMLKPVMIEELVKIPARIREAIELKESALKYKSLLTNLKTPEQDKRILVQSKKKLEHIILKNIIFLQAENNYTFIYIKNQNRIIVSKTLKDYEDILCEEEDSFFVRIHKTFIVNVNHVKSIERGEDCFAVLADNTRLEVSRRKKTPLINKFELFIKQS